MSLRALLAQERSDLVELLRTLSEDEWAAASLCEGWQVRDVVAHLLYDAIPPSEYLVGAVRAGFRVNALNDRFVRSMRPRSTRELLSALEATIGRGMFHRFTPSVALADLTVHHQDIRRPLGRPRVIESERLIAVLNHPDPFARPRRLTHGLRFVATDLPWTNGHGAEVHGTGEALMLASVGRSVVLDELTGPGVTELRERLHRA